MVVNKEHPEQERRNTMKRYVGKLTIALLVITILSVGTMSGALDVWAQKKGGPLAKQIQGSWILVSAHNVLPDGKTVEQFGSNPRGSMILTPAGHFSIFMMKASIPKFASNNRLKSTNEENQAVVEGSIAYFGTYKVANEKEHIVSLHVEGSTFPNFEYQDQTRVMIVEGDELKYTNPTSGIGGTTYAVWKRAK
jgi:hypothetical protein